ncbi:hypothetical protein NS206_08300 [Microbacterium testaceum]|nr:hypothetical protein NS206_08300 [Microbacterium testaceum]
MPPRWSRRRRRGWLRATARCPRSAGPCRSVGTSAPRPTEQRRRCSGANGWTSGGTRISPGRW